jgi:hypothetical protein
MLFQGFQTTEVNPNRTRYSPAQENLKGSRHKRGAKATCGSFESAKNQATISMSQGRRNRQGGKSEEKIEGSSRFARYTQRIIEVEQLTWDECYIQADALAGSGQVFGSDRLETRNLQAVKNIRELCRHTEACAEVAMPCYKLPNARQSMEMAWRGMNRAMSIILELL